MSQTQTPQTPINVTDGQYAKWEQLTRDFVRRNELDSSGFQTVLGYDHLADDMDRMARRALKRAEQKALTVTNIKLTDSQQAAKAIMGTNFFGTQEAAQHFGALWTQAQFDALATVPYSTEILEECKNTHVLVAGYPMTIVQVRSIARQAKKDKTFNVPSESGWYRNANFASRVKVRVRWYLVRKKPVDYSCGKDWWHQNQLLKDERVPKTCVIVYTIIGHFFNTGERLFENVSVRTSDTDPRRHYVPVTIGGFKADWPKIGDYAREFAYDDIGLSAVRNI